MSYIIVSSKYGPHQVEEGVLVCWSRRPQYPHTVAVNAKGILQYFEERGPEAPVAFKNTAGDWERGPVPVANLVEHARTAIAEGSEIFSLHKSSFIEAPTQMVHTPLAVTQSGIPVYASFDAAVRGMNLALDPNAKANSISRYCRETMTRIVFGPDGNVSVG